MNVLSSIYLWLTCGTHNVFPQSALVSRTGSPLVGCVKCKMFLSASAIISLVDYVGGRGFTKWLYVVNSLFLVFSLMNYVSTTVFVSDLLLHLCWRVWQSNKAALSLMVLSSHTISNSDKKQMKNTVSIGLNHCTPVWTCSMLAYFKTRFAPGLGELYTCQAGNAHGRVGLGDIGYTVHVVPQGCCSHPHGIFTCNCRSMILPTTSLRGGFSEISGHIH